MIVVLDNYDSFTYNLVQYLLELGADVQVFRNDERGVDDILGLNPSGILISPGPCAPDQAGISVPLIRAAAGRVPLFGVCLGHQAIGAAFGADIVRAPEVRHGKTSDIEHDGKGCFAGLANPLVQTRYHSLVIDPKTISDQFAVTAKSSDDNQVMGIRHNTMPIEGVQFHPESILSQQGHELLANFLKQTEDG